MFDTDLGGPLDLVSEYSEAVHTKTEEISRIPALAVNPNQGDAPADEDVYTSYVPEFQIARTRAKDQSVEPHKREFDAKQRSPEQGRAGHIVLPDCDDQRGEDVLRRGGSLA